MTVRHPKAFALMRPANFSGTFDWDFLLDCFAPTKIQPTDIDCVIEKNGHFLAFETKSQDVEIPRGQSILIDNLLRSGKWTFLIVHGKGFQTISSVVICRPLRTIADGERLDPCGPNRLRQLVRRWFVWANGSDPDPKMTDVIDWQEEYERSSLWDKREQ